MSVCGVCGNDINPNAKDCPYCGAPNEVERPQTTKKKLVRTVLLKEHQPTVAQALDRLKEELVESRKGGIKILRVIHGYGSSGKGGSIKTAVAQKLRKWMDEGAIKNFITGEQHFEFGARHNHLLKKYPELEENWVQDRGNPGITFVEL